MDVQFTEEQDFLRTNAKSLLTKEAPISLVRELMDSEHSCSEELYSKMAELGGTGLIFPEEYGGMGMDIVSLCVLLEEQGRALAPTPFLSSVVMAGICILEAGSAAQKEEYLPSIIDGSKIGTLAFFENNGQWHASDVSLEAKANGDEFVLTGTKRFVPDAGRADFLIVPAKVSGDEGVTLFLVDPKAPGVTVRGVAYSDQTRKVFEISLDGVKLSTKDMLGKCGKSTAALARVLDITRVALCAEMTGGAQAVLDMSVEYATTRKQFGVAIGSFQAIQHKCADMYVAVEGSRSATYYSAWSLQEHTDKSSIDAHKAKAFCSDAFNLVSAHGIQIHGGFGYTWEADLHLYFKRCRASEEAFGNGSWNREQIAASLLDDPAS